MKSRGLTVGLSEFAMPAIDDLAQTVTAMRPIVPAKDFEISKRFYIELRFQPLTLTDRLVEMRLRLFAWNRRAIAFRATPPLRSEKIAA